MQIQNKSTQPSLSVDDYVTIRQLTTSNPAFTEGGIRALIFELNRTALTAVFVG